LEVDLNEKDIDLAFSVASLLLGAFCRMREEEFE
jgi:hypothetical protein